MSSFLTSTPFIFQAPLGCDDFIITAQQLIVYVCMYTSKSDMTQMECE